MANNLDASTVLMVQNSNGDMVPIGVSQDGGLIPFNGEASGVEKAIVAYSLIWDEANAKFRILKESDLLAGGSGVTGVISIAGLDGELTDQEMKGALSLERVDNTSDLEKPVSTATQAAIDIVAGGLLTTSHLLSEHLDDNDNPHNVTKEQVGLGDVDNTRDIDKILSNPQKAYIDSVLEGFETENIQDISNKVGELEEVKRPLGGIETFGSGNTVSLNGLGINPVNSSDWVIMADLVLNVVDDVYYQSVPMGSNSYSTSGGWTLWFKSTEVQLRYNNGGGSSSWTYSTIHSAVSTGRHALVLAYVSGTVYTSLDGGVTWGTEVTPTVTLEPLKYIASAFARLGGFNGGFSRIALYNYDTRTAAVDYFRYGVAAADRYAADYTSTTWIGGRYGGFGTPSTFSQAGTTLTLAASAANVGCRIPIKAVVGSRITIKGTYSGVTSGFVWGFGSQSGSVDSVRKVLSGSSSITTDGTFTLIMQVGEGYAPNCLWIATLEAGATATIAIDKITVDGCVLDLTPDNVTESGRWIDMSGSGNDAVPGTNTVVTPLNPQPWALNSDLDKKVDQSQIVQTTGSATSNFMSQKAVTDALNAKFDANNDNIFSKLSNYLEIYEDTNTLFLPEMEGRSVSFYFDFLSSTQYSNPQKPYIVKSYFNSLGSFIGVRFGEYYDGIGLDFYDASLSTTTTNEYELTLSGRVFLGVIINDNDISIYVNGSLVVTYTYPRYENITGKFELFSQYTSFIDIGNVFIFQSSSVTYEPSLRKNLSPPRQMLSSLMAWYSSSSMNKNGTWYDVSGKENHLSFFPSASYPYYSFPFLEKEFSTSPSRFNGNGGVYSLTGQPSTINGFNFSKEVVPLRSDGWSIFTAITPNSSLEVPIFVFSIKDSTDLFYLNLTDNRFYLNRITSSGSNVSSVSLCYAPITTGKEFKIALFCGSDESFGSINNLSITTQWSSIAGLISGFSRVFTDLSYKTGDCLYSKFTVLNYNLFADKRPSNQAINSYFSNGLGDDQGGQNVLIGPEWENVGYDTFSVSENRIVASGNSTYTGYAQKKLARVIPKNSFITIKGILHSKSYSSAYIRLGSDSSDNLMLLKSFSNGVVTEDQPFSVTSYFQRTTGIPTKIILYSSGNVAYPPSIDIEFTEIYVKGVEVDFTQENVTIIDGKTVWLDSSANENHLTLTDRSLFSAQNPSPFSSKKEVGEKVSSDGTIKNMIKLTQVEYDALTVKDSNTLYIIA